MNTQEDKKLVSSKSKRWNSKVACFFRHLYVVFYMPVRHFIWPYGCVWNVGGDRCEGKVKFQGLYGNQIRIPICAEHFHRHKCIMFLHSQRQDIEKIIKQDVEWIKQEAHKLAAANNVDIDKDVKP
jgi:hypothetical protein